MFCVLHWEPNSPVSSWRLTSLCSLILKKTSFLWKEFDPSLTSEQCTVCSKFSQQCKGGRPIAKKKKRTQHAPKDCDRSELEMSTFVPQAVSTPPKMPLSVETKKSLRLYHQEVPLTRVHQIEVSQKLSKYNVTSS